MKKLNLLWEKTYNDRLKSNGLDLAQLKNYLELFSQPKLIDLASKLLNQQL